MAVTVYVKGTTVASVSLAVPKGRTLQASTDGSLIFVFDEQGQTTALFSTVNVIGVSVD